MFFGINKGINTSYLRLYFDLCNMCLCADGVGRYMPRKFWIERVKAFRKREKEY